MSASIGENLARVGGTTWALHCVRRGQSGVGKWGWNSNVELHYIGRGQSWSGMQNIGKCVS